MTLHLLYIMGNAELLNRHKVAMVGARRPTPYGNQMAERRGEDLAERGLAGVSLLTRGIDAVSGATKLSDSESKDRAGEFGSGGSRECAIFRGH